MAIQYKRKACATCAYWNGSRMDHVLNMKNGCSYKIKGMISRGESDELNAK